MVNIWILMKTIIKYSKRNVDSQWGLPYFSKSENLNYYLLCDFPLSFKKNMLNIVVTDIFYQNISLDTDIFNFGYLTISANILSKTLSNIKIYRRYYGVMNDSLYYKIEDQFSIFVIGY